MMCELCFFFNLIKEKLDIELKEYKSVDVNIIEL